MVWVFSCRLRFYGTGRAFRNGSSSSGVILLPEPCFPVGSCAMLTGPTKAIDQAKPCTLNPQKPQRPKPPTTTTLKTLEPHTPSSNNAHTTPKASRLQASLRVFGLKVSGVGFGYGVYLFWGDAGAGWRVSVSRSRTPNP